MMLTGCQKDSQSVQVIPFEGIPDLVALEEPLEEWADRLGEPSKEEAEFFSQYYFYPERGLVVEVKSSRGQEPKIASIFTNSPQYQTETGMKVGEPFSAAMENLDGAGFAALSGVGDLPKLWGRSDTRRNITYFTTTDISALASEELSELPVEYIQWEQDSFDRRAELAMDFPPLESPEEPNESITISGDGVEGVVKFGESLAEIKERLGEPDAEFSTGRYALYRDHALRFEFDHSDEGLKGIVTNDPRYVTPRGFRVGNQLSEVRPEELLGGGFSTGSAGLPAVSLVADIEDFNLQYASTGDEQEGAPIEYIVVESW